MMMTAMTMLSRRILCTRLGSFPFPIPFIIHLTRRLHGASFNGLHLFHTSLPQFTAPQKLQSSSAGGSYLSIFFKEFPSLYLFRPFSTLHSEVVSIVYPLILFNTRPPPHGCLAIIIDCIKRVAQEEQLQRHL